MLGNEQQSLSQTGKINLAAIQLDSKGVLFSLTSRKLKQILFVIHNKERNIVKVSST